MINIYYAREQLPPFGNSIFLAGPTPRQNTVPSWRPDAIAEIHRAWRGRTDTLHIFTPESRDGVRAEHYDDQVQWETFARGDADVVLYWIPRDLATLPGFTTNVEFGLDVGGEKTVVLGAPPDCPNPERNRYLIWVAKQHDMPVYETLADTVRGAVEFL